MLILKEKFSILHRLVNQDRGGGKTQAICKAAKEINATVIVSAERFAETLRHDFDAKISTLSKIYSRGDSGPYLFDNQFIIELACMGVELGKDHTHLLEKHQQLEEKCRRLESVIQKNTETIVTQKEKIRFLENLESTHSKDWRDFRESYQILQRENLNLREEIEFLRRFGNKDCTSMADKALKDYREENDKL